MPQERKLWSKTLVALMCVNFINVLVFYLLMVGSGVGAVLLLGLGLVGAGVATVRIARVDPVTALGENR